MNRRDFLKNSSLLSLSPLLISNPFDTITPTLESKTLSNTGVYLIKDAEILSMDTAIGHLQKGSILIENGVIKAIGSTVSCPANAIIIDGHNAVVMPGLIDSHWHLWTSVMRSMPGYSSDEGYFPMSVKYSRLMSGRDMKIISKYSLAEAINSGITSISDFNHNTRTFEHAKAGLDAFAEMDMRGQFLYGDHRDLKESDPTNFAEIKRLLELVAKDKKYQKIRVDLGSRSVKYPKIQEDWNNARKLGMRIVIHASSRVNAHEGEIKKLHDMGILSKDVNIIHGNAITEQEALYVSQAGSSITMTPYSEMRVGYGFPPIKILKKHAILTGVGIDTVALSGDGNLFSTLKLLKNVGNATTLDEFYMNPYELLEMATINGAKILGIDKVVGSLAVGKQADLILMRKDDLNFSGNSQTERLVIEAASAANIDLVMIGGKILKENGKLTYPNTNQLFEEAQEVSKRIQRQVEGS
ncbi:Melamine deaminase [compost metagenome]